MPAVNLKNLVDQIQTAVRTNQRGYISETEMNSLVDGGQQGLQNYLVGLQQPQGKSRFPLVSDQETSDISALLRPFIVTSNGTLASGKWTFDANIPVLKEDNYYTDNEERIRIPNDGRLNTFKKSKIRMPSTENYIGQWVSSTELKVTPVPTTVTLIGLKPVPKTNVLYGADYKVDEATSTELLWNQRAIPFLLYFALKQYGLSMNSPFMAQLAAQLQAASI